MVGRVRPARERVGIEVVSKRTVSWVVVEKRVGRRARTENRESC